MKPFAKNKISWPLFLLISTSGGWSLVAEARDYFNPALLEQHGESRERVDLSTFENDIQQPGIYHVDVLVNGEKVETRDIKFYLHIKSGNLEDSELQPCLTVADLKRYGLRVEMFPQLQNTQSCSVLTAIPDASAQLFFNSQHLELSFPQAALKAQARGYVPPEQWDEGIPAILLNYSFTGANETARNNQSEDNNSQYLNLRPGINLGAWRLRNYTTWSRSSKGRSDWNTVYSYAQRNIISLRSQLLLGDSNSPAEIFDSVAFRGGQLASDDEMLPDSQKGYAPSVRGIARTHAQVVIRQNGYIIYQSYVAPGAFAITDMYPTGGSGDLYVTIRESDGSEQHMVVPFASLPLLQREGRLKYSLTGGQYRTYDSSVDKTPFIQATAIQGLPHGITLYGGTQQASKYQSLAFGLGSNLGNIGAISVDVTQAWSKSKNKPRDSGQSWRVRYSKNFVNTGTNFAIAGYRYSTRGYATLNETFDSYRNNTNSWMPERRRNRAEMTLSQNLWQGAGALTLSLLGEDYWNDDRRMRSLNLGYNNSWHGISYGLNYSYNRNSTSRLGEDGGSRHRIYDKDQLFAFNVSIPLDRWMNNSWVNYSLNSKRHGKTTNTVGLNGTLLEARNLSWNLQESYTNRGEGSGRSLSADYRGTYGELNGGYSRDNNSSRLNYGVQGSLLVHGNGITLAQPAGETVALVKAPGVAGAVVNNETGVKTDFRGYTLVPYASAYRKNTISLDPNSLADDVELEQTSKTTVPTRGAVASVDFSSRIGQRVLMTLLQANGQPVPFGAIVSTTNDGSDRGSIVGDKGLVYLSGLKPNGTLHVSWGEQSEKRCKIPYRLPQDIKQAVLELNSQCQ